MSDQNAWYNQEQFWELLEPMLFNEQRQANAQVEVDNLIRLLNIQKEDRILDLCCGTGRHSLQLARRGYDVVGVDLTRGYLERATRNAENQDLKLDFVLGDMREYCQPDSYDVVINLFGSFGYFNDPEDDRQVVRNMYASLRSGGRFLIETSGKEIVSREFRERDWWEQADMLVVEERKPIQKWSRIQTHWIVIKGNQRFEQTVTVRCFSAVELSTLLSTGGFTSVQIYGDLEGNDYDLRAKRLVVVGTK